MDRPAALIALPPATRARLDAQHVEQAEGGFCETCGSLWEWPCAVRSTLAALDAAVQARDAVEQALQQARGWIHATTLEPGHEHWMTPPGYPWSDLLEVADERDA